MKVENETPNNRNLFIREDLRPIKELDKKIIEIASEIKLIRLFNPFNLVVPIVNPYPENNVNQFLQELANPHLYEPYERWQFTRRVFNPLWTKGSGFEGHLIGLPEEKIISTLEEFEESIWRNISDESRGGSSHKKKELERFLDNPNKQISLEFATNMRIIFQMLLARARAIRSKLQMDNQENKQFQDKVYSASHVISVSWSFIDNPGIFNLEFSNLITNHQVGNDIRSQFPALAEIGRFGYPPLGLILRYFARGF